MFELPLFELAIKARTGPAQWFAEFVATFGLIVTILAVSRFKGEAIPVAVGLYITAAYWFTASTSFANPAVTIARALTDSFAGIAPGDVPMFIVAQLCGALAGLALMRWFFFVASREKNVFLVPPSRRISCSRSARRSLHPYDPDGDNERRWVLDRRRRNRFRLLSNAAC